MQSLVQALEGRRLCTSAKAWSMWRVVGSAGTAITPAHYMDARAMHGPPPEPSPHRSNACASDFCEWVAAPLLPSVRGAKAGSSVYAPHQHILTRAPMHASRPDVMAGDIFAAHSYEYFATLRSWCGTPRRSALMRFCSLTARSSIASSSLGNDSCTAAAAQWRQVEQVRRSVRSAVTRQRGEGPAVQDGLWQPSPPTWLSPAARFADLRVLPSLLCPKSKRTGKCHNVLQQPSGHGDGKTRPVRIARKRQARAAIC